MHCSTDVHTSEQHAYTLHAWGWVVGTGTVRTPAAGTALQLFTLVRGGICGSWPCVPQNQQVPSFAVLLCRHAPAVLLCSCCAIPTCCRTMPLPR
jgi:hypothetical protein